VTLEEQKKQLKKILQMLSSGDNDKIPLKPSEKEMIEKANEAVAKAKKIRRRTQRVMRKRLRPLKRMRRPNN
jgi:type IV secretory pathway VirB4 component